MSIDFAVTDRIAHLKINRPEKLNALCRDLMASINCALKNIETKANVLVVSGGEKAFAVGVDLHEIHATNYENAVLNNFINDEWESIFNVRIPVIAAVAGYALGGGFEIALMSDIIIAADNAKFGFPEINIGLMPGLGGTQMLTKLIGAKAASKIIMTGEYVSAAQALQLGIISEITDEKQLMDIAFQCARNISKKPLTSLIAIKEAIRMSLDVGISAGMSMERCMFRSLFATSAKENSVKQFLRKNTQR